MAQPCTPWITDDDVAECCNVETSDPVIYEAVAQQASDILFQLSGRQFPGECERSVRPSCDPCWCGYQVLSRGHIVGPWDWGYPLTSYCDSCLVACSPSLVKLAGYPVREVSEVLIDGVPLAADEYRLVNDRYLMRTESGHWPWSQNLTLPDTEDHTWSITYTYGADPPSLGVSAAAQLACELYKACNNQDCALPAGTTRVTRQGITIDKLAFTSWAYGKAGAWQTGLSLVDAFLSAYNPAALPRRPIFYAPGKRQYAQGW